MVKITKLFITIVLAMQFTAADLAQAIESNYTEKVTQHLNTLLTHGKDSYGTVTSPLFMMVIDDKTLIAPSDPNYAVLGSRLPPDSRSLGGANLWWQSSLMRVLDRMAEYNPDFRTAAQSHINYYIDNFSVFTQYESGNMLWWGDHLNHNAFTESFVVPNKEEHQVNMNFNDPMAMWDMMWRYRPAQTQHEIEEIWRLHIFDKSVGKWDRHARDQEHWAVGFCEAGSSFMRAFAFMYAKTGEQVWKDRGQLLRDHLWNQRNTTTNLLPNAANTCWERGDDFYLRIYSNSATPGYWVPALIYGYKVYGDIQWLEQAEAAMQAYLTYAYDQQAKGFYRWIRIDGVYQPDYQEVEAGYTGFWRNDPGFRNGAKIALGFLDTYEVSRKQFLLDGAKIIGATLLTETPRSDTGSGPGAFAEYYARAINILIRLHRFTGQQSYLDRAVYMADNAVTNLWNDQNKIFRGHYNHGYEVIDGVDNLCDALVDLDRYLARGVLERWNDDFKDDTILTGRWVESCNERTGAWVDTIGGGKLVLKDMSTGGKVSVKRAFDGIDEDRALEVGFVVKVNRLEPDAISIELRDQAGVNAITIGVGNDQGVWKWKYDNGQSVWMDKQFAEGEACSFEIIAAGSQLSISINGTPTVYDIALNNALTAQDISEIKLSTADSGTGTVEFDSIYTEDTSIPVRMIDLLQPLIKDWLRITGNLPPQIPGGAPVLSYKFDEITGNIAADDAGNIDGVLKNFATDDLHWVQGQYAGAIKLNGVNQWIDVPDTFFANFHNRTISLWFKVPQVPAEVARIFATRSDYRIYISLDTSMRVTAQLASTAAVGYTVVELNKWTHLALVMADTPDGNEVAYFYINGILTGTTAPFPRHTAAALTGANIGSYNHGNGGFANMFVDEFKIFNSVLSAAEIIWLAAVPCDYNKDGIVNFIDFTMIQTNS